jgi:competence protein ComGC
MFSLKIMFNVSSCIFERFKGDGDGFTLAKLLVVISIISLLISILMPVLGKARIVARRTACRSHLRGILSIK